MLRRRQVEVVHADRVEEGLGPNVDEEVVDADREDDLEQLMWMTARTMKWAKSMSMSEVDATDGRREERDLVEEEDVEVVVQKISMSHCGCGGESLLVAREVGLALLPC